VSWQRGVAAFAQAAVWLFRSERARVYVLLVPETLLTKICMVSSSEETELMLLMLVERRIVAGVWCGAVW
jgi:hypothetical protein